MFDEMLFDSDSGECDETIQGCFFFITAIIGGDGHWRPRGLSSLHQRQ